MSLAVSIGLPPHNIPSLYAAHHYYLGTTPCMTLYWDGEDERGEMPKGRLHKIIGQTINSPQALVLPDDHLLFSS